MLVVIAVAGVFLYSVTTHKSVYISPLAVGYKINASLGRDEDINALKKQLAEKNIEFSEIKRRDKYYVITLKDKSQIFIAIEKDIKSQLASLQLILSRLTMEGKGFKELDLRFDKPVIWLK